MFFYRPSRQMIKRVLQIRSQSVPSTAFPIHCSLNYPTVRRNIVCDTGVADERYEIRQHVQISSTLFIACC